MKCPNCESEMDDSCPECQHTKGDTACECQYCTSDECQFCTEEWEKEIKLQLIEALESNNLGEYFKWTKTQSEVTKDKIQEILFSLLPDVGEQS